MVLFQLESILVSVAVTLAAVPILLTLWFLLHGRKARVYDLQSYFSPTQKVGELVDSAANPNESFREYLTDRYAEQHAAVRYIVPLITFHLVYLVGLYWALVALGVSAGSVLADRSLGWPDALETAAVSGAVGFMGGVLIVLWHLFWRSMLTDLQPRVFIHAAARLLVAPILGVVFGAFGAVLGFTNAPVLFIAFGAGMFADQALRALERSWRQRMGLTDDLEQLLPLRNIEGISHNDELRLWEDGITDAEHLLVETIDNLLINTKYSLERIIDWKDQAILYAYVADDIPKWRKVMNRGAMDVLGMAKKYYTDDRPALLQALSESVGQPVPILERFIDTIFQDPRVRQLWLYLVSSYPSEAVEALDEAEDKGGSDGTAVAAVPPTPPAPATVPVPPSSVVELAVPEPPSSGEPAGTPPKDEPTRGPGPGAADEEDDTGRGGGAPPAMSRSK